MRYLIAVLLVLAAVLAVLWSQETGEPDGTTGVAVERAVVSPGPAPAEPVMKDDAAPAEALPEKAVLDISVHTVEELRVLLERAENYAIAPGPAGEDASIVLVLHGPEVEFFSIKNYETYKDIVDQAARLDAFDVVDVRICQSMMRERGIAPEDIPSFIEQVPLGPAEVDRLVQEGYVYF